MLGKGRERQEGIEAVVSVERRCWGRGGKGRQVPGRWCQWKGDAGEGRQAGEQVKSDCSVFRKEIREEEIVTNVEAWCCLLVWDAGERDVLHGGDW